MSQHQSTPSMAAPITRPRGVSRNTYILTIVIVAAMAFILGTRGNQILGAIAPYVGIKVETGTLDLSSVQKSYQNLKANFDGELDEQALIDGASRGLVAAAGDQYTVFMDAKETEAFNKELSGDIGGGVGAEIGIRSDQPTIIRVLPGNAAEKAGLLSGDVIVAVNDVSMVGKTSTEAADKIRGEVGTTVKLSIVRGGEKMDFSVTRATVNNPSVRSSVTDGIGTLTITRFDDKTSAQARAAAQDFKRQNVKSVILDLRGNGGGFLTAAQDVAGLWLDKQVVVSERMNGKVVDELKSGGNPVLAGIPTIVLVDGGSASASEIVAGALQDHGAATLLGEKTFGKGTVQQVIPMENGTQLKVTIARWYTPKGKNITKEGIVPNKTVTISSDDINAGRDPQMDAARQTVGR